MDRRHTADRPVWIRRNKRTSLRINLYRSLLGCVTWKDFNFWYIPGLRDYDVILKASLVSPAHPKFANVRLQSCLFRKWHIFLIQLLKMNSYHTNLTPKSKSQMKKKMTQVLLICIQTHIAVFFVLYFLFFHIKQSQLFQCVLTCEMFFFISHSTFSKCWTWHLENNHKESSPLFL